MRRRRAAVTLLVGTILALLLLWAVSPGILAWLAVNELARRYPQNTPYIPPHAHFPPTHRVEVTATAYSSTVDQTDGDPFMAACGPVKPGTVALSRDLFARYPCGTVVSLDGRTYIVNDTMNSRFTRRVDVWMTSRGSAIRYGVRRRLALGVPQR